MKPLTCNKAFTRYRAALPRGIALLLLMGVALPSLAAGSEPLPEAVTIGHLLEIVRDKSPRYVALRQRLEAAQAEVVAAAVLPNPKLSYGRNDLLSQRNTMYDGRVQQAITLELPVLIAGQRGARVEAAEKQVELTEATLEADYAALIHEVWRLFVKLLADQQRLATLEETAADMAHLAMIVDGRAQAGNASQYDVLRIELESKGIRTRLESLRSELVASTGDLGVLLGLPDWKPTAIGELAALGVPADAGKLWQEAERLNPDLEAARRGERAADASLARARRERWPVPSFLVGSAFTDKPYGNTSFAGVTVELPLFDRGQGAMARAAAEKQSALLERELMTARTRVAVERAVELLRRRRESRLRFDSEVVGKLGELKAMGEASYRLGKGSLLELLDASRSRTETRLTYLELLQAETEAELEALRASGLLLATVETAVSQSRQPPSAKARADGAPAQ